MSYRTRVNGIQIFGNNEYYPEWLDFIKSQGIEIGEECEYEGEITDVMGAIVTIEKIIIRLENERRKDIENFERLWRNVKNPEDIPEIKPRSLFDMTYEFDNYMVDLENYPDNDFNLSITDRMSELQKNAYIFMSCAFIRACKDFIEKDKHFTVPQHFICYKVKDGCKISVSAY